MLFGGEPFLQTGTSSDYEWLYDNTGGRNHPAPATFYRTKEPADGFFSVGDLIQTSIGSATSFVQTVKSLNDTGPIPLLIKPLDYNRVWGDEGSGASHDGSIWYPVPPAGYVSLGVILQQGYSKPDIKHYRCIHASRVSAVLVGPLRWSDVGSGSKNDVSLYPITGTPGISIAQPNYNVFSGTAYAIKGY